MPEVRTGGARANLRARHAERAVLALGDVFLLDRRGEARPAGARVELLARREERLARHHVEVDSGLVVVPEGVPERHLRSAFLRDVALLGPALLLAPLQLGLVPIVAHWGGPGFHRALGCSRSVSGPPGAAGDGQAATRTSPVGKAWWHVRWSAHQRHRYIAPLERAPARCHRADRLTLRRQAGLAHQPAVALARGAAAFFDRPDDEALAAPHVAGGEHALHVGGERAVLGFVRCASATRSCSRRTRMAASSRATRPCAAPLRVEPAALPPVASRRPPSATSLLVARRG